MHILLRSVLVSARTGVEAADTALSSPTRVRSVSKSKPSRRSSNPKRTRIVWGAFGVAMTLAAAFLVATSGGLREIPLAATLTDDGISGAAPKELDTARWKAIVIHHSGSPGGSPESIDRLHRSWGFAGLGYHFVIGNGLDFGDGAVFVGSRWTNQEPGAHVAKRAAGATPDADWFNEHSIGVCLVGNGDRRSFTEAQIQQLEALVLELQRELNIPDSQVYLHSDLVQVANPGRFFPVAAFESALRD